MGNVDYTQVEINAVSKDLTKIKGNETIKHVCNIANITVISALDARNSAWAS